jgi:hypothetical protein
MFFGLYEAPIIVIITNTAAKDSAKDILSSGFGLYEKTKYRNGGVKSRKITTTPQLKYAIGST